MANGEVPTVPQPAPPNAQERLQRLKKVVGHLDHTWSDVLQRQLCMQALGQREDLHKALEQTYAAYVTNMLQRVLVTDLLREIGVLVLDPDKGSASVLRAFSALRDPELLKELRAEHEIVRPAIHTGDLPEHVWKQVEVQREARERAVQTERLDGALKELAVLEPTVGELEIAGRLTTIRNKGVAHYDVVRDGDGGWKLWAESGIEVTWAEIDAYMDTCTRCIELLYGVVCHTFFDFQDATKGYQRNVEQFIGALTVGLTADKEREARERAEELERRRAEHGI